MMELLITRWSMVICGLLVLSAIGSSFMTLECELEKEASWEVRLILISTIEDAMGMGMEIRIDMSRVLPSVFWSVSFESIWMTISDGDEEWRYPLDSVMNIVAEGQDGRLVLDAYDTLIVEPVGRLSRCQAENVETSFCMVSMNVSHSSRLL